jgi:hypothetical protein
MERQEDSMQNDGRSERAQQHPVARIETRAMPPKQVARDG